MGFRISKYRDTEFNDINDSNVWNLETTVFADSVSDLPTPDEINHYHLVIGCKAIVVTTGDKYYLNSSGVWNLSSSGGGGGGGGNANIESHTTQEWETLGTVTSSLNTIYVYTDYVDISGNKSPAIKIGDGTTIISNLPFLGDPHDVTDVYYDSSNAKLKKIVNGFTSDVFTADATPTDGSKNPVQSDGVYDALAGKADSATTLAGYGITDAKIESGIITLSSNTITPLTSSDIASTYSPSGTAPVNGTAITDALDPISETEYSQLVTKDRPLYFIYED